MRNDSAEKIASTDDVVCTCYELTRDAFLSLMARHRNLDFQEMLDAAGVGNKCTACRLDLELIYTENFDRLPPVGAAPGHALRPVAARSLKQRIYDWLDRLGPMLPMPLGNWAPIIAAPGLQEFLLVSNDPPLYSEDVTAPPCDVTVIVRDAEGRVRHRQVYMVTHAEPLNLDVSQFLPVQDAGALPAIGSAEVLRKWRAPEVRGTTRPQFLIKAPNGCGAVHTQAESGKGGTWYTALYRPAEDRILLSMINPAARELQVIFSYPYDAPTGAPAEIKATIPPHGSMLHEVSLSEAGHGLSEDMPFSIHIAASGPHKCHLFTADRHLSRFAVDHPTSG